MLRRMFPILLLAVACGGGAVRGDEEQDAAFHLSSASFEKTATRIHWVAAANSIGEKQGFFNALMADWSNFGHLLTQPEQNDVLYWMALAQIELNDANAELNAGLQHEIAGVNWYTWATDQNNQGNFTEAIYGALQAIAEFTLAQGRFSAAIGNANDAFNHCIQADIILRNYRPPAPPPV